MYIKRAECRLRSKLVSRKEKILKERKMLHRKGFQKKMKRNATR